MKNIITNKGMLSGAAVGAGTGFVLAWISGADKVATTLMFSAIGGVIGYSPEESMSSFSGGGKRQKFSEFVSRRPPQQGR